MGGVKLVVGDVAIVVCESFGGTFGGRFVVVMTGSGFDLVVCPLGRLLCVDELSELCNDLVPSLFGVIAISSISGSEVVTMGGALV